MRKSAVVLVALLLYVGGCGEGGTPPSNSSSVPTLPPTGPGISPNSQPADIEIQLQALEFVPTDQNDPRKWVRPTDNTTVEIDAEGRVTITFQMEGGAVRCPVSAETFGAELIELEQYKNRTDLLEETSCQ